MTYTIMNDIYFTNFLQTKPNLSEESIKGYKRVLRKFTKSTNLTLAEIINNCKNQQDIVIEKTISENTDDKGNSIIKKQLIHFDVNGPDSNVKKYINTHIEYCIEKGNSNNTINNNLVLIKAFLKFYNISLPKIDSLENDVKNWYLLEKEDFKYIINDCTITHASLIKFLQSSGMRIRDATSLTIGDFMEATRDYHNFTEVTDFIDNAPDDMIGTWNFHPTKTIKFKVQCITFNDPESSNLILQNLRKIKNNVNRSISKSDALFGSQKKNYEKSISSQAISVEFWRKNQKLHDYKVLKIKEAIENGELSVEDYDKEIDRIPKFHAHACRKYFETTIAKNCGDLRICTLMEGHVSPVKTDSSYIKQDIENVKETYMSSIPDLSLENTDVKVYTSDIRREIEAKIKNMSKENETLKEKYDEKEAEVQEINDRLSAIENILSETHSKDEILERISK